VNRAEKGQIIDQVRATLEQSALAAVSHYRGLTVAEMVELRQKLRQAGAFSRVVKNTLTIHALAGTSFGPLKPLLSGPTLLVLSADPVAPSKVLVEFAAKHPNLVLLGGVLDGDAISVADLDMLSKLPSREMLLAKLMGSMQAPIANTVGVLAALPSGLVRILDQVREKKAAQEEEVAAA
jgi:large subunit ribosomal protein L10